MAAGEAEVEERGVIDIETVAPVAGNVAILTVDTDSFVGDGTPAAIGSGTVTAAAVVAVVVVFVAVAGDRVAVAVAGGRGSGGESS